MSCCDPAAIKAALTTFVSKAQLADATLAVVSVMMKGEMDEPEEDPAYKAGKKSAGASDD